MSSLKAWAFAGATAVMTLSTAQAADLPPIYTPEPVPMVADFASGWYLRGDIGVSNQRVGSLHNVLYDTTTVTNLAKGFESAPFFGVGFGYQYSGWLRFDATAEYRAKAAFRGLDRYVDATLPTGFGVDDYHASKSEWVFMANAYFDLGTWGGVTPFVGAGVGAAYNVISNFRDVNVATNGLAYAGSAGTWNLAWAVHAGLAYRVAPGVQGVGLDQAFKPMIVCSCNVLSDKDVRSALDGAPARPRTAGQVYGCLGCSAQCGRCARTIKRIMDEALRVCPAPCSCCPHAHRRTPAHVPHSPTVA